MMDETLFFGMSNELPLEEVVLFKRSLGTGAKYYLLKVRERPGNKHRDRREAWVVVRYPRKGELVPRGNTVYAERGRLV